MVYPLGADQIICLRLAKAPISSELAGIAVFTKSPLSDAGPLLAESREVPPGRCLGAARGGSRKLVLAYKRGALKTSEAPRA